MVFSGDTDPARTGDHITMPGGEEGVLPSEYKETEWLRAFCGRKCPLLLCRVIHDPGITGDNYSDKVFGG